MRISLATADHDRQLRRLSYDMPMPGWIRLILTCEPSWFFGQQVLGHKTQTIIAEDDHGTVLGCGVRSIRRVYIEGRATCIGYLSGLRAVQAVRGSNVLARGYRYLRQLHEADRLVPAYLTTIVEENRKVATLLTSRRAGLPVYLDRGRLITSAIHLRQKRPGRPSSDGMEIRTGGEIPLDELLGFLQREGSKRQFFPILDHAQFETLRQLGLSVGDFRVALRDGKIVGVTAAWDQRAFRQTMVAGYAPLLRLLRPLLNVGLRLSGCRPLPRPPQRLNFFHAAFTCIHDDNPAVFGALLERLHADHQYSKHDYFVLGLHELDPLRAAIRRFHAFHYTSRLYLVFWEDGRPVADSLNPGKLPHIETAML